MIEGQKDAARRTSVEMGAEVMVDGVPIHFACYEKVVPTYAHQIWRPFSVETEEGVMVGKVGDWLAVGPAGEMYPIDADVFGRSYRAILKREQG